MAERATLDGLDRKILQILRVDGRIRNADLAKQVGLSESACLRRVGQLERSGVIRGYAALVESVPAEGALVVLIQITLERQTDDFLDRFETAIRRCREVAACFLMTGTSDYLVRVEVADAAAYERLHRETLSRLPGVSRLQSSFAIRTVVGAPASIGERR